MMLSTLRAQNRSILSREIKDSSRLVERNRRPVSTRPLCLTHLAADPPALASETASRRKRKPSVVSAFLIYSNPNGLALICYYADADRLQNLKLRIARTRYIHLTERLRVV